MEGDVRVFVYGTLMPGEPLWPLLEPYAADWAPATSFGRLWDTGNGYPGARFDGRGDPVSGVLVLLDGARTTKAVEVLDDIEEEGTLYRRVEVTTSGGPAFAYEWLGAVEGLRMLPEGWPRAT